MTIDFKNNILKTNENNKFNNCIIKNFTNLACNIKSHSKFVSKKYNLAIWPVINIGFNLKFKKFYF